MRPCRRFYSFWLMAGVVHGVQILSGEGPPLVDSPVRNQTIIYANSIADYLETTGNVGVIATEETNTTNTTTNTTLDGILSITAGVNIAWTTANSLEFDASSGIVMEGPIILNGPQGQLSFSGVGDNTFIVSNTTDNEAALLTVHVHDWILNSTTMDLTGGRWTTTGTVQLHATETAEIAHTTWTMSCSASDESFWNAKAINLQNVNLTATDCPISVDSEEYFTSNGTWVLLEDSPLTIQSMNGGSIHWKSPLVANGSVTFTAGHTVQVESSLLVNGAVDLTADEQVTVQGNSISADGGITITSNGNVLIDSPLQVTGNADITITAADTITLDNRAAFSGECGALVITDSVSGTVTTLFFPDADQDNVTDCIRYCPNEETSTDPLCDACPNDANKTAPGFCGCGVPDVDTDQDGESDCTDLCPNDANKTAPGICGCGVPDVDTDQDGTLDCQDECPDDAAKTTEGECGCGISDTDTDQDGVPDCMDQCKYNPEMVEPAAFRGCK